MPSTRAPSRGLRRDRADAAADRHQSGAGPLLLSGGAATEIAPHSTRPSRSWIIWCWKACSRWPGPRSARRTHSAPHAHTRLLLLLANVTLFGFTLLDRSGGGEGERLKEQIQPDKIKLLTPQQVAALARPRSPRSPTSAWSGARSRTRSGPRARRGGAARIGRLMTQKRSEGNGSYWSSCRGREPGRRRQRLAELKRPASRISW